MRSLRELSGVPPCILTELTKDSEKPYELVGIDRCNYIDDWPTILQALARLPRIHTLQLDGYSPIELTKLAPLWTSAIGDRLRKIVISLPFSPRRNGTDWIEEYFLAFEKSQFAEIEFRLRYCCTIIFTRDAKNRLGILQAMRKHHSEEYKLESILTVLEQLPSDSLSAFALVANTENRIEGRPSAASLGKLQLALQRFTRLQEITLPDAFDDDLGSLSTK